jgi:UDP-glucose 4-epimerase
MRILITGSSGQIGTNLALRCLELGHEVAGIDCRANGWTDAFACTIGDLTRPLADGSWPGAFAGGRPIRPDVVVHLAAHAKVHQLVQQPGRALENVAMVHHALEYCRRHAVPIVFASSREVYGDLPRERVGEADADFRATASPYAASKIAGESMVYAYARNYGLPYLVFRLSNVYGRCDNDLERMERVVPLFIRRIAEGRQVTVFGTEKILDFTYVDDCVDGITAGIERLAAGRLGGETFNLAFGEGHSLTQLAEWIGEATGARPRVVLERPRAGEVIRYVADIGKARAMLGYAPRVGLREGLRRAVAWGLGEGAATTGRRTAAR